MNETFLELTPVQYPPSSIKKIHLNIKQHSQCFRPHWHERMEFLRIKRGEIFVEHGGTLTVASAGELVIISPKILHKGYTLNKNVEYDVLMFDIRSFYNETEICKKLLPAIFDNTAVFKSVTNNSEIIRCADSIFEDTEEGALETISKIYRLLDLLCQNALLELNVQPKDITIKKVIDYLEKNSANEIDISTLCKQFGYTSAHLCRKFKKATGLPPMAYLKIYRLESAHKKLKNSNKSISDIASECGFPDPNYFTRCFKSHFGVPPIQYRKTK